MNIDSIRTFVRNFNGLEQLTDGLETTRCWMVGGCLRDLLLDKQPEDVDLAFDSDPTSFARRWSRKTGGRWFWLDRERKQSRVLLADGRSVDFAPLRAADIRQDLALRDFTINALAWPLNGPDFSLIDPLGGVGDLENHLLRQCGETAFEDDPLRMLKGVRHAVQLSLSLSEETFRNICHSSRLIKGVAAERSRDELIKILAGSDIASGIQLLLRTGLLEALFNVSLSSEETESVVHDMLAFARYLEHLEVHVAFIWSDLILAYLIEKCRPRNLPTLLDSGLRLSRYQQRMIPQLITFKEPLPHLTEGLSRRRQALIFESLQPFALEKLVRWNFRRDDVTGDQITALHEAFEHEQVFGRVPDLISGREMIRILGDPLGKRLGFLLAAIKRAEITGEIESREDALHWLEEQK